MPNVWSNGTAVEYGDFRVSDADSVFFDEAGIATGDPDTLLIGTGSMVGSATLFAVGPDEHVTTWIGPSTLFTNPGKMIADNAGRLLVSDGSPVLFTGQVFTIVDDTVTQLFQVDTPLSHLAVDQNDNIYSAGGDGTIRIHNSSGILQDNTFVTDLAGGPLPLAFGPGGDFGDDLYAVNDGNLLRIDANGGVTQLGTGLGNIRDIVFGPDGAMYLSDYDLGEIQRLTRAVGFHPGDADLNGVTDLTDFNIWNANKFTSGTDWGLGDFNGDSTTDLSDFNIWNANKFTSASSGAAPVPTQVPEPGTLAMLSAFGLLALGWAWRRRRTA